MRYDVKPSLDRHIFKQTAYKTKTINYIHRNMRGGIRF